MIDLWLSYSLVKVLLFLNWHVFRKNTPVFCFHCFIHYFTWTCGYAVLLAASANLGFKTGFRFVNSQVVTSNTRKHSLQEINVSLLNPLPGLTPTLLTYSMNTRWTEMSYTVLHSRTEEFIHSRLNLWPNQIKLIMQMSSLLRNHW